MKVKKVRPYIQYGKTGEEKTLLFGLGTRNRYYKRLFFAGVVLVFFYINVGIEVRRAE